jgi:hypothetical protein
VYGWGISCSELGKYLLVLLVLLGGLVVSAALLGWVIHKAKGRDVRGRNVTTQGDGSDNAKDNPER